MRRIAVLRAALLLVVLAVAGGGYFAWRNVHGHAARTARTGPAKPAAPRAAFVPPPGAPKVEADLDPDTVDPFAVRLAKVNLLAHKTIVTNAEYHDSANGQRYFTAVVTSCKDLNALWDIKRGVLAAKVEGPLALKADFPIFSFVEYGQAGQWGVISCDGTT